MKKILYVDDSEDMLDIIKVVLGNSGYQILTATSGAEAMDICSNEEPDLILMDLHMPDLDGFATTRQLRSNGYRNPIVVLTASENEEDKMKAKAAGCTDYILKTLDMSDVEGVIDRYIADVGGFND